MQFTDKQEIEDYISVLKYRYEALNNQVATAMHDRNEVRIKLISAMYKLEKL